MYLRSFNGAFKKKQFLKVYLENILAFYVDNLKIYTFATYIFEQNFEKWYPVKFHAWISTILFCVSVLNKASAHGCHNQVQCEKRECSRK